MRKGRCSNDPKNCTLAASRVELPYAGIDSVCPECNAPLAAISPGQSTVSPPVAPSPPPAPPPPPPPVAASAPPYAAPSPAYDDRGDPRSSRRADFDYEDDYDRAPTNGIMRLTQMAIVGAAIALVGFFAWRYVQPRPATAPELSTNNGNASSVGAQITQISPAQMRRIATNAQAYTAPDANSAVMGTLPAGSLLDVTGQAQVNGVQWFRVTLPNDSSKSAFVRADQMANLGEGDLTISPFDGTTQNGQPTTGPTNQVVAPEAVGPVQPRSPETFYVASRQANVRQGANASSAKVGTFEFRDPVTVIAQRSVGTRTWYQIQLPSGGTGWIMGRLIATAPRDAPIDAEPLLPKKDVPPPPKPNQTYDGATSEIGKRDNQEAMSAYGPGTTLRVDAATANLRRDPDPAGKNVIESMGRDTLMSVEDVRVVNGVPWYQVTSPNGAKGWVSGRTVVEDR